MDKLKSIKIKYQDGTYSDEIPIGVSVENVDYNDTKTLKQVLNLDVTKGTVEERLNKQSNDISSMSTTVNNANENASAASGKADAVDTRLDNIIIESGTSEAEVVAARTNANTGVTYTTLAQRLDTENSEIKEDLSQGVALERYNKLSPSWTLGFIRSDGTFGNSTNSVLSGSDAYSGFIIAESDVMSVEIKSGYKALVAEYVIPARGAVNFISKTEYATGAVEFNVHAGGYCLFVLMLESEQRFAPSDVPDDAVVVTGWRKAINHYNFIKPLKITDGYFLPDRYINSKNAWQETNTKKAAMLFKVGKGYYTIIANTVYYTIWALLAKDFSLDSVPEMPPFVQYGGRNTIAKGATSTIYVAQDSVLYVYYSAQGGDIYYPTSITCRADADSSLNVNGASADAKIIGSKFDYALAPLERIYNLYNSDDVYGGVGLNQGTITTDATAKTTDFIAIPKKNNKNLLYTHLLINGEYGGSISFYDVSKNYISTAQVTSYVQNVADSEYIRCTTPIDANVTITVSNETIIPQVREQLIFNNGRRNWFSQRMVSDGCMTSMIKTALAYMDSDEYGYGTEHTAFGEECIKTTKDVHTESSGYEDERYQIDCSTYAMLIIMGIKPQCSRYHYTKNIPAPYGYVFNALANYEGWVYGVPQTMNTKRLYANSIADYANRNGYLYSVNDDFSNVQPGDIVFLSNQSASYNFFANIGHCAFVYNVIDMENGAKAIETLEANGGTGNPCHRHLYLEKPDEMLYGTKLPYSYVSGNAKNIANFSSDVSIAGSATADIQLSEPIRKGNVYTVIAHASDIISGYITLSVDGLSYTGYTSEDVIHRPDGIVVVRFTVPMSYDVDATKIVLTYVGDDSITLNNVSVYDGYVTESVI